MKKKKQNREEFRSEIAAKLSEHIRRNGMRKADAARALGISRQRLHSYLKKKMTPSSDFLCDVAQKWDIEFIYRGRSFAAGAFKEARETRLKGPVQADLFESPQIFRNDQVEVRIQRKSAKGFDLSIEIRQVS